MARITRETFIRNYAARSGLTAHFAKSGILDLAAGHNRVVLIALPCGCREESCEGWAMLSAEQALDHLFLHAPEPLRSAYREALHFSGGIQDS